MHQEIILATLASTTMISDLDSASRYICLQSNVVLDSVDTESPSSHSLRYYLKLIEHVSSEVMWKLAIATFSNSWPSGFVNTGFVNNMLENLILLSRDAEEKAEKLEELHNNYINEQKVELAGASRVDAANAQTNCQILHNMQLLHSSLNIATLRCLDTYSFVSKVYETGSKDVSDNISTNDEVIIPTDDIISTLKSVQLNVDLAQSILQTINSALVPIEKQEIQIPAKNTIEIVQNHGNTSEQVRHLIMPRFYHVSACTFIILVKSKARKLATRLEGNWREALKLFCISPLFNQSTFYFTARISLTYFFLLLGKSCF